ncbi:hypothetical protein CRU96_07905 [Malaciobacter halophilus]|nr:hypothetical protein [Malaciobacter halophilus]RYA23484.1 hypothetical protein CRU96_07905 [Malaciobacter halophilus]
MKKNTNNNLGKKAILGVVIMFLSLILMIDLNDPINNFFGDFTIIISLIFGIYGMYLLFPYLRSIEKYN